MVDVTVEIDLDDIDSDDMAEHLREEGWFVSEDHAGLKELALDHLEDVIELEEIDEHLEEASDDAIKAEMINRGLELPEEV